jgi:hypothetical protein
MANLPSENEQRSAVKPSVVHYAARVDSGELGSFETGG